MTKRFKYHLGFICEKRDGEYYSFTIREVCDLLNNFYEENQQLQKMNELLIAEIRWNKEQKIQSKDKTPRLIPKEVRERIKNDKKI